jgi:hypothetical protein
MGAIKFTVQQKAGDPASYASVSPRVVAEDAGADTADYRFSIPSVSSYIGCSTYVTPMGRDVKFYMNLSGNLTAGSGDFVVSVKPKTAPVAESETPAAQEPARTEQTVTPSETDVAVAPSPEAQTPANTQASSEAETGPDAGSDADTPTGNTADSGANENAAPEPADGASGETGGALSGGEAATGTEESGAGIGNEAGPEATDIAASENEPVESSGASGGSLPGDAAATSGISGAQGDKDAARGGISDGLIGLIALVAVAVVVCAVMVLRKRKAK